MTWVDDVLARSTKRSRRLGRIALALVLASAVGSVVWLVSLIAYIAWCATA